MFSVEALNSPVAQSFTADNLAPLVPELTSVVPPTTTNGLSSLTGQKRSVRPARNRCQHPSEQLLAKLELLCETATDCHTPFTLLLLEPDRFQMMRCSLGSRAAEQLLLDFQIRLLQLQPDTGMMARFQEDEFTILIEGESTQVVMDIAQKIHHSLQTPFRINGLDIFLTVSIGITTSDISLHQPSLLFSDAELAVCQAQKCGGNSSVLFDQELREQTMKQFHLENDLRLGILRQEFFLEYQPIVALDSQELTGFEALVRWQHPQQGLVSPAAFIPLAEATGQIIPLGRWVLQEACQQLKVWQAQFPQYPDLTMSVNISGQQFSQPDFIAQLDRVLSATGVAGQYLKLEITETVLMENAELADSILSQLKDRQIGLCIDDFGTGYSSLSYLQRFAVNTLKIDRSFIAQIDSDPKSIKILQIILMLARQLDMDVVAEGIELSEHYWQLRALQCQQGQGYLFEKPLKATAAAHLLADPWWIGLR
jgi:diguanylate cyclase (GGDEF)-like protein